MRIGAHISSAGGHHQVFERARAIGAEAVQLFISAPQQWKLPACTDEQIEAFRAEQARLYLQYIEQRYRDLPEPRPLQDRGRKAPSPVAKPAGDELAPMPED